MRVSKAEQPSVSHCTVLTYNYYQQIFLNLLFSFLAAYDDDFIHERVRFPPASTNQLIG
jgi:hypothetical protein